jgi:hypothetical protein
MMLKEFLPAKTLPEEQLTFTTSPTEYRLWAVHASGIRVNAGGTFPPLKNQHFTVHSILTKFH